MRGIDRGDQLMDYYNVGRSQRSGGNVFLHTF